MFCVFLLTKSLITTTILIVCPFTPTLLFIHLPKTWSKSKMNFECNGLVLSYNRNIVLINNIQPFVTF